MKRGVQGEIIPPSPFCFKDLLEKILFERKTECKNYYLFLKKHFGSLFC
jgi:hypothetical protein